MTTFKQPPKTTTTSHATRPVVKEAPSEKSIEDSNVKKVDEVQIEEADLAKLNQFQQRLARKLRGDF